LSASRVRQSDLPQGLNTDGGLGRCQKAGEPRDRPVGFDADAERSTLSTRDGSFELWICATASTKSRIGRVGSLRASGRVENNVDHVTLKLERAATLYGIAVQGGAPLEDYLLSLLGP